MTASPYWLLTGFSTDKVYKSTDEGANWDAGVNGPSGAGDPRGLAVDNDGAWLYADNQTNKIYKSTDEGATWDAGVATPASSPQALAVDNDGAWLCTDNQTDKIYKSTDEGANWDSGVNLPAGEGAPQGLAVDESGNWLLVGNQTDKVYKSTDEGANWDSGVNLPAGEGAPQGLAVDESGNWLLVGNQTDKVYKSTDEGANWDAGVNGPSGESNPRGLSVWRGTPGLSANPAHVSWLFAVPQPQIEITDPFAGRVSLPPEISDDQYDAWLTSQYAEPVVVAQLYRNSTESDYFATRSFLTGPDDTPADLAIDGILDDNLHVAESLSEMNAGSLRVLRAAGLDLDTYHERPWYGWPIKLLLGDANWRLENFRVQATAVNGGIVERSPYEMEVILEDAEDWLQFEVRGPRIYGYVRNVPAELIDAANLEYRFREDRALGGAINHFQIRDSGVLLYDYAASDNTWDADHIANQVVATAKSRGTFRLPAQAAGTVTVTWSIGTDLVLSDLLQPFVDDGRLTLRTGNIAAFPGNDLVGGYWIPHNESQALGDILHRLVDSAGGSFRINPHGELEFFRLQLPGDTAALDLDPDDIVQDGMRLVGVQQPFEKITARYDRNWYVHSADSLPASLTGQVRHDLSVQFRQTREQTVLTDTGPYPKITSATLDFFSHGAGIGAELYRLAAIRRKPRYTWQLDGRANAMLARINDTVRVSYPGFGLDQGVNMRVIGRDRRLGQRHVRLTLWQ